MKLPSVDDLFSTEESRQEALSDGLLVVELRMQYIGIAIGNKANTQIMQKMLPSQPGPLKLSHVRFREFFRWLSDSLSAVSCSCVSEQNVPQIKKWSDIF